jgi:hypothetical protein
LSLGDEYRPLLRWIEIRFLSGTGLAALTEDLAFPPECVWCDISDRLIHPLSGWNSEIVPDFPEIFEEFKEKQVALLWRGSRDGFRASDFHGRCDGRANTLTVILDTKGNIFGGFTPVEWESRVWNWKEGNENNCFKADPSLKTFLFTLMNPHNFPARRFALKAEEKDRAIFCYSENGPIFGWDIHISDHCNTNTGSFTYRFGECYTNDTGLEGTTFFTGSRYFQLKEIEVFEITA